MKAFQRFATSISLAVLLCFTALAQTTNSGGTTPPKTTTQTTPPATTQALPTPTLVTVAAKGTDVRDVLSNLFQQSKSSFVIDPGIHYALWLSLNQVDFDEALGIICHQAQLNAHQDDGIWYIKKESTVKTTTPPPTTPAKPAITAKDLHRKVSLWIKKISLVDLMKRLSDKTQVAILVDKSVPEFKLDASLYHKTLEYALAKITEATHLAYKIDGSQILIYQPQPAVAVQVGPKH